MMFRLGTTMKMCDFKYVKFEVLRAIGSLLGISCDGVREPHHLKGHPFAQTFLPFIPFCTHAYSPCYSPGPCTPAIGHFCPELPYFSKANPLHTLRDTFTC
jgi:hypothetical protein